jgi:3-deoxy-D-manno-octulosonate 8-phosphate phosphatase (KDO 8-P phosphatase)
MNYKEIFKNITTVVLDVDGVLTNGDIILMPGMQPVRKMNAKDGYAMQLAVRNGIRNGRSLLVADLQRSKSDCED